jgi:hypothetical protein
VLVTERPEIARLFLEPSEVSLWPVGSLVSGQRVAVADLTRSVARRQQDRHRSEHGNLVAEMVATVDKPESRAERLARPEKETREISAEPVGPHQVAAVAAAVELGSSLAESVGTDRRKRQEHLRPEPQDQKDLVVAVAAEEDQECREPRAERAAPAVC